MKVITFKHRFRGEVTLYQRLKERGADFSEPLRTLFLLFVRLFAFVLKGFKLQVELMEADEQIELTDEYWDKARATRLMGHLEERVHVTDPEAKVSILNPHESGLAGYLIEYSPESVYSKSVLGGEMKVVYNPAKLGET